MSSPQRSGKGKGASSRLRVQVWREPETAGMDAQTVARYDAFQTIFAEPAVDGNMASQRDRATLDNDTQALTYGEVEYLGFLDMLKLAAAKVSDRQKKTDRSTFTAIWDVFVLFLFSLT